MAFNNALVNVPTGLGRFQRPTILALFFMNMICPKRFLIVVAVSVVGFFLALHAGMSSDTDEYLKWYYAVEFFIAAVLGWPIAIYLGFKKLFGFGSNILGMEVWVIQFIGYLVAFLLYDKYKRK